MARYILKTLGCKANLADSQQIEQTLQKAGLTPGVSSRVGQSAEQSKGVELCIINSCTVTDEADRQTKRLAAKLARENPGAKVVVTGCGAEVDPEGLLAARGVDYVVGNQDKDNLVELVLSSDILNPKNNRKILGGATTYQDMLSRHPMDREWPAVSESFLPPPTALEGYSEKTRAFLKIQEGCNAFCTYCIIPYGRGPSRSLEPEKLVEQVNSLIRSGIREIVITGTNIGDYSTGGTSDPHLGDLLSRIFNETTIERVRVSSLDPVEITPQIKSLMANEPRFCPHFHVSLQSPHSKILKIMKRKYSFEHVKECLQSISEISAPLGGVFVGMDLITGFPGETEEVFEWTYSALESLPWSRLHVFPYSERKGTPATRLPDSVPQHLRTKRTHKLNQLSLSRLADLHRKVLAQSVAQSQALESILLERVHSSFMPESQSQASWISGYTSNYLRVMIRREADSPLQANQLVNAMPSDLVFDSKTGDAALIAKVLT